MKCIGIHAYSGSLTIAALHAGLIPVIQLETDLDFCKDARNYFGGELIYYNHFAKWDVPMEYITPSEIDLVYGQPQWQSARKFGKIFNRSFKNTSTWQFIEFINQINPRFILLTAPKKAKEDILRRLKEFAPQYHLTFIVTNPILHGLPHFRDILFIVGVKRKSDLAILHDVINSLRPPDFENIEDIPTVWKTIGKFWPIPVSEEGTNDFITVSGFEKPMNGHIIPRKSKAINNRLLWESIPYLKEGRHLAYIEEKPDIIAEKPIIYFQKGQLPVRLHKNQPSPSIFAALRYIHPVEDRPMSLRELAMLNGIPYNYDLNNIYVDGLQVIGRFTPLAACVWIMQVLDIVNKSSKSSLIIEPNQTIQLFSKKSKSVYTELGRSNGKWVRNKELKMNDKVIERLKK